MMTCYKLVVSDIYSSQCKNLGTSKHNNVVRKVDQNATEHFPSWELFKSVELKKKHKLTEMTGKIT